MDMRAVDRSSRFAERVAKMLERVECRPAVSAGDREAAYRLRYDAYLRRNLLTPRVDAMLYDERYDPIPSALTTVTYIDGELASTVRVHVFTDPQTVSPANDVFPEVLHPLLSSRRVVVEPSRLAASAEMAAKFPELPYFALRPPWMAAQHFNADFIVLSCASGHEGFIGGYAGMRLGQARATIRRSVRRSSAWVSISPRAGIASRPVIHRTVRRHPSAMRFSPSSPCRWADKKIPPTLRGSGSARELEAR